MFTAGIYFSISFPRVLYLTKQVEFTLFGFFSYFQTKDLQGSLEVQDLES